VAFFVAVLSSSALIAAFLPAASAAATGAPCGDIREAPARLSTNEMSTSILCLINRVRVHHDLHPLNSNPDLYDSAAWHSVSMVTHGYFGHEGPGGSMDSRISRAGYLATAGRFAIGEDIGGGDGLVGSPLTVFTEWMHSPPHRENILNPGFRDAGVGVAHGYPFGGGARAATYTVDFGFRAG
jgi:uncharacterized protein YkwD